MSMSLYIWMTLPVKSHDHLKESVEFPTWETLVLLSLAAVLAVNIYKEKLQASGRTCM